MKRIVTNLSLQILVAFLGMLMVSACTREDENLAWLLAVTDPLADIEPTTEAETIPFHMDVEDVNGPTDFVFENTTTYPVRVTVIDGVNPVDSTLVQIMEYTSGGPRVSFRAVTDAEGNVSGSFTIENRAEPRVTVELTYLGKEYRFEIDLTNVREIKRYIYVDGYLEQIEISDRDGDGIADELDDYPDDAGRATLVKIPADNYFTIAFEDLFPTPGDADFNDYVVRVKSEQDLDAQGKVVRMRSEFTHVAKGAGYNHTFHMKLPGTGQYTLKRTAADGTVALDTALPLSDAGVEILPSSETTLAQSNTATGQSFVTGMTAQFEAVFETPLTGLAFPYDMYLYVKNTKKEIHFPGKYTNSDGSDPYMDANGFPWALLIPGDWSWPLERNNIHQAYPLFQSWYETAGQQAADWYKTADFNLVFNK